MNKFPHMAPKIHRGERQSIASDVFSFGYLVTHLSQVHNFRSMRFFQISSRHYSGIRSIERFLIEVVKRASFFLAQATS